MACREYKDTLSAYIDDELKPLTRLRVEAHLRSCGRCRRQLRQTRRATEMVRGLERVEVPAFAASRARSIALGDRARGWERLRGGLLSRPQTLPLKPVLLAGLAFMMVLVISQTFDTVVAPRMDPQTATPMPPPTPTRGQTAPGLPGTLSADRLSDAQKAEIARRVLQAHPQEARPAPAQGSPAPELRAAAALPDEDASAQPATRDEPPQQARDLGPLQPEPGRMAQAAAQTYEPSPQATGVPAIVAPPQEETRIAAAGQPTGVFTIPMVAAPEAATETPPTSTDEIAAPAQAPARRAATPEVLELGETYRQVLVLARRDDGRLDAAFHAADVEPSASLRRFDDEEPAAAMEAEAVRVLEDLPPPEPDLDTGIAPPLPVYRPAPVLEHRGRRYRDIGPLSPALLRVHVLADGTVGSLALLSGSGLRWLDRAVVEAVRAWEFRPAERHQQAVAVSIELLVEFELE